MRYVIETPAGIVAGFSRQYQCVQVAGVLPIARTFASRKSAKAFIERYGDLGYGLESASAKIRSLEVVRREMTNALR